MGIKSDKTFEEIVERLLALFQPLETRDDDAPAQPSSPDTATVPSANLISLPSEDNTQ